MRITSFLLSTLFLYTIVYSTIYCKTFKGFNALQASVSQEIEVPSNKKNSNEKAPEQNKYHNSKICLNCLLSNGFIQFDILTNVVNLKYFNIQQNQFEKFSFKNFSQNSSPARAPPHKVSNFS